MLLASCQTITANAGRVVSRHGAFGVQRRRDRIHSKSLLCGHPGEARACRLQICFWACVGRGGRLSLSDTLSVGRRWKFYSVSCYWLFLQLKCGLHLHIWSQRFPSSTQAERVRAHIGVECVALVQVFVHEAREHLALARLILLNVGLHCALSLSSDSPKFQQVVAYVFACEWGI